MAKNNWDDMSATGAMEDGNNNTSEYRAPKDITTRIENRLKRAVSEIGRAVASFLEPVKKIVILSIIIAVIIFMVLIIIAAGYKYLLETDSIKADDKKTEILKEAKLLNGEYLYGYKGQTSDLEKFYETVEFFLKEDDQVFTRVATTSRDKRYESIESILSGMSREEKIYQLLMVQGVVSDGNLLSNVNYGGYIVATNSNYNNNLGSIGSNYKIAPFISTDDEGGKVRRAASQFKTNARTYGDNKDYDKLYSDELEKSNYLLGLGINLNLGPVTDVISKSNAALYERSFSGDTAIVEECIKTIVEARKNSSVNGISISSSLKHYPGYPDTSTNSDYGEAKSDRSKSDIDKNIEVFKSGINAGAQSVMVSNVIYTNYDANNPASLSPKIIGDLRANFDGVIMTDDIGQATGVTNQPNRFARAIIAGNDMVLLWEGQVSEAYNQINNAIDNGELTEEQINNSIRRILKWKADVGLLTQVTGTNNNQNNNQNNNAQGSTSAIRKTETITIKQNDDGEYCIVTKLNEKVDKIYDSLKADRNILLKQFKNEKKAKESIKLWLIAEYSSQYVNLSENVEKYKHDYNGDYIQGIVKVKRYGIDEEGKETSKYLTYKTEEEFNELKENYKNNGDSTVFNYFTIDEQDNLVVAKYVKETQTSTWTQSEDGKQPIPEGDNYIRYTISEQKLNYRNMVLPYTMPYFLFITLTMYGENADFTNEVAKLVIDSEMVIGIRDHVTTTVTTTIDKYLREEMTREYAKVEATALDATKEAHGTFYKYLINPSSTLVESRDAENDFAANENNTKLLGINETPTYEKTTINTVVSNSVVMNIEYIDGWCFNHKMEYEAKVTDTSTQNANDIQNTEYATTKNYDNNTIKGLVDVGEISNKVNSNKNLKTIYTEAVDKIKQLKGTEILTRYYNANLSYIQENQYRNNTYKVLSQYNLASMLINGSSPNYNGINQEYLASIGIEVENDEQVQTIIENVRTTYNGIVNKMGTTQAKADIINNEIKTKIVEFGTEQKERIINRTITTKIDVNTKEYIKISTRTSETTEKTDRKPGAGEENFVSILCETKYKKVKHLLTGSTAKWFFETLEKEEETVEIVDLLKYLFYKTTNKDYGVTEFDFDFTSKNITTMNSIANMYGRDILTKFTMAWEGTVTDTAGNYVIHRASTDPTIGYGIYLYYNLDYFQEAGFFTGVTWEEWKGSLYNERKTQQGQRLCDIDGTVLTNADIDKVKNNILKAHKESVKSFLARNGITDLEEYKIDALVQVNYQNGNINGLMNYYPNNMEAFFLSWWGDGQTNRKQTVLDLWNTGVYKDKNGNEIVETDFASDDLLLVAKKVHDHICDNQYYYSSDGNKSAGAYVGDGISTGAPVPGTGVQYTDCSAYVTWVLYEYGYKDLNSQRTSHWYCNESNWSHYGWQRVQLSEIQPGDILVKNGHVEIYIGDWSACPEHPNGHDAGDSFNAGSTEAIRSRYSDHGYNWLMNSSGFQFAIRITPPNS